MVPSIVPRSAHQIHPRATAYCAGKFDSLGAWRNVDNRHSHLPCLQSVRLTASSTARLSILCSFFIVVSYGAQSFLRLYGKCFFMAVMAMDSWQNFYLQSTGQEGLGAKFEATPQGLLDLLFRDEKHETEDTLMGQFPANGRSSHHLQNQYSSNLL